MDFMEDFGAFALIQITMAEFWYIPFSAQLVLPSKTVGSETSTFLLTQQVAKRLVPDCSGADDFTSDAKVSE
jgi:hypothetical protein